MSIKRFKAVASVARELNKIKPLANASAGILTHERLPFPAHAVKLRGIWKSYFSCFGACLNGVQCMSR